jgi:hypothetical protein
MFNRLHDEEDQSTSRGVHACRLIAALLALIAFLSLRSVQAQNPGVLAIEILAKKYEHSICPVHLRILSGAFEPIR